jgi:hypothetical protein
MGVHKLGDNAAIPRPTLDDVNSLSLKVKKNTQHTFAHSPVPPLFPLKY